MSPKDPLLNLEIPFNNLPFLPPEKEKLETKDILKQVVKSAGILSELKGLVYTLPNPDILLNAVILKEAQASSQIENIITTQDKLYKALSAKGVQVDAATKEVLRYREAILKGFHQVKKKGYINTNIILQIQKALEQNNAGIRRLPGTELKNAVTGKIIYTPPDNYEKILELMKNFEDYLNEEAEFSPLINLAVQHYQFESIHPFYDGNGRTGRIINVLYLILQDCLSSPILYLSDYIINNKKDYYKLLQKVRTHHKWEDWILFILKAVEITSSKTILQIRKINFLFQQSCDLAKKEFPKSFKKELIELLFEQPYSKVDYVVEKLNISRITATKYLNELKDIGILESRQIWRENIYINTRLFDLLKG